MKWVVRTYVCRNGVTEKTKFPVRDLEGSTIRTREDRRAVNRAAKAAGSARRILARALNDNFVRGDAFLTLELSNAGMEKVEARAARMKGILDWEDKKHVAMEVEMENLHRRVARACKQTGVDYLYVSAVSDMTDREDLEHSARLHIHMVCNAAVADIVAKKWGALGPCTRRDLSAWASGGACDWTGLATYIIEQTRTVDGGKRYTASRNLHRSSPSPKDDKVARNPYAQLRAPSGTLLLEANVSRYGTQYIRYVKLEYVDDDGGGGRYDLPA